MCIYMFTIPKLNTLKVAQKRISLPELKIRLVDMKLSIIEFWTTNCLIVNYLTKKGK